MAREASTGLASALTPAEIVCRMVPHYHAVLHDHLWPPGALFSAPVLGWCKDDHGSRMITFGQCDHLRRDHLRAPAPCLGPSYSSRFRRRRIAAPPAHRARPPASKRSVSVSGMTGTTGAIGPTGGGGGRGGGGGGNGGGGGSGGGGGGGGGGGTGGGGGNGPGPGTGPAAQTSGPCATSCCAPPMALFVVTVTSPLVAGIPVSVVLMVTGPPTGAVPATGPTVVTTPVRTGIVSTGPDPGNSPLMVAVTVKVLLIGAPSVTVPETPEFWGVRLAVDVVGQPCALTVAGLARARTSRRSVSINQPCWRFERYAISTPHRRVSCIASPPLSCRAA